MVHRLYIVLVFIAFYFPNIRNICDFEWSAMVYKIYWKDQFSSQGLNYIGLQD
jgi:hypothetical protein